MKISLERSNVTKDQESKIAALESKLKCNIVPLQSKVRHAKLSPDQYAQLHNLEPALGAALVAYEPDVSYRIVRPSQDQLNRLKQLEKETGFILVAYECVTSQSPVESYLPPGLETVSLSESQAEALQKAESETGLILMACRSAKTQSAKAKK